MCYKCSVLNARLLEQQVTRKLYESMAGLTMSLLIQVEVNYNFSGSLSHLCIFGSVYTLENGTICYELDGAGVAEHTSHTTRCYKNSILSFSKIIIQFQWVTATYR